MYSLTKELATLNELGIGVLVTAPLQGKADKREIAQGKMAFQPMEEDGFLLNSIEKQVSFALVISRANNASDIRVVTVGPNRDKPIITLGNQGADSAPINIRVVTTHTNYQSLATTYPQDNNVRVITTRDNVFRMFQIGIVTRINEQNQSEYFLTVQEMYKSELILDGNTVTAPDFSGYDNWIDLQVLVSEMIDRSSLPTEKQVSKKRSTPRFKVNEGRVLYFNLVDGHGRVETKTGVHFLHWSQINIPDRLGYLSSGQKVTFASILNTAGKGTQLIGVKPA